MSVPIVFHGQDLNQTIDYYTRAKKIKDVSSALTQLKQLTISDVEIIHFMAILLVLDELPAHLITEQLFDLILQKFKQNIRLYQYYSEQGNYQSILFKSAKHQAYALSWQLEAEQKNLPPASLLIKKTLARERVLNPLSFIGYCRTPFCALNNLDSVQQQQYEARLNAVLEEHSQRYDEQKSVTYVGCASGQMGKDLLHLAELAQYYQQANKKIATLKLYFIDLQYQALIKQKNNKGDLSFVEMVYAKLYQRVYSQVVNLVSSLFDCPLELHLFGDITSATDYFSQTPQEHCLFIAEDYFESPGEKTDNIVRQVKTLISRLSESSQSFSYFDACKDEVEHKLYLEANGISQTLRL